MNCVSCGKLYIVSTPIGNMADISARAVEILDKVDFILSEDTRETDKLLSRFDIKKPQIPHNDHNYQQTKDLILERLESGESAALVSDNGTPLISDPGFKLVRYLRSEDIEITSIPGPNAAIAALTVSGIPTDKFVFLGFLPKSKAQKNKLLKEYGNHEASLIIYESPKRIRKLITEVQNALGNRTVSIVKDLTKKFEKVVTDEIKNINAEEIKEKGEYILVVAKEGYKINE